MLIFPLELREAVPEYVLRCLLWLFFSWTHPAQRRGRPAVPEGTALRW